MTSVHNTVELSWIDVGTMAGGYPLRLALHTIRGKPGPTVAVLGTVHGDEPITAETVRRVVGELRTADLSGTVLAIPVLDPPGFESSTRNTWVDMANLNRVYPGSPSGTVSEQISFAVTASVLDRSDAVIDLHSGPWQFCLDYSYAYPGQQAFVDAFGSAATIHCPPIRGSSSQVMADRGKLAVLAEFGGGLIEDERYIRKGVTGTLNCLKFLKMLPGEPVIERPPVQAEKVHSFRSRHGGLLMPDATGHDMGRIVPQGTLLGRIISPYTFETLEEFRAPYDQNLIVGVGSGISQIHPGNLACKVVEPA